MFNCFGFYEEGRHRESQQEVIENEQYFLTDAIMVFYDLLLERGYKYNELYDMTLGELRNAIKQSNKGLGYTIYKQALLIGLAFGGKKFPKSPEEASPELYPPKKRYKMPDWIKERYYKQKGVL